MDTLGKLPDGLIEVEKELAAFHCEVFVSMNAMGYRIELFHPIQEGFLFAFESGALITVYVTLKRFALGLKVPATMPDVQEKQYIERILAWEKTHE